METICRKSSWVDLAVAGLFFFSASSRETTAVIWEIGQNFTGARQGTDSDASPADSTGAAGLVHFVEFDNGRFAVYEKATAKQVQSMTDIQFWKDAGISFASGLGTTDPRLIFDFDSQRWFASMVSYSVSSPRQRTNRFLLAVSETSDPTGSWTGFSFPSDPNGQNFADFPTLGVDQEGVYMSGDMFDPTENPVGPSLVAIPKADLLASPARITGRTYLQNLTYATRGNILQPAVTMGHATTAESVLAVSDLGLDFQPVNSLTLSQIFNGGVSNSASLSNPAIVLDVPAYSVPLNPPQPDGTDNLDDGDARFSSAVKRVNDALYATHAIQVDTRTAVRWYRIDAAKNTLIEAGTITDPKLHLFFPSIAANESGTVVIGCNGSSEQTYVSSYAVVGELRDGKLTFGELTLLKAGSASYQDTDPTGISRWGDYSATTVDPVDSHRFWTIQMIPASASAWATQITELITGIRLTVRPVGGQLLVSWPATEPGYQLQYAPSLTPTPIWAAVPKVAGITNNIATVVLPNTGTAGFFRLGPALPLK